ncbi:MAG: hypothetical protein GQ534_06580, partial [Candidatus Delongbacteria bacterium]|nr:hypothetical protein [Candidatus Delongbacteria bacterium]
MTFDEIFKKRIDRLIRSIISKEIIDVFIRLFFILLASLLMLSVIEFSYNMNRAYRTAIMVIYMVAAVIFSIKIITKFFHNNLQYFYNDRTKYISLDHLYPNLEFLFFYDLLKVRDNLKSKDHSVIDSAISLNASKFNPYNLPKTFKNRYILKHIVLPVILIVFMILPYKHFPIKDSLFRLINFNTEFENYSTHKLFLTNRNFTIIQGNETILSCEISGIFPDRVHIHKRPVTSEIFSSVSASLIDSAAIYNDKPSQDFYYYFRSEETHSDTGFVKVLKRPEINNFKTRVDFPSYTKLKSEYYQDFIGSITVLKGSNLTFDIEPSNELDSLKIFQKDGLGYHSKKLKKNKISFKFTTRMHKDTEFYFKLYYSVDSLLISNNDPIIYKVNILNDSYPIVNLILPEDNFQLGENLEFPIFATAFDDFSIKNIVLYSRKIPAFSTFSSKSNSKFLSEEILFEQKSDGVCVVNTLKIIKELNLLPDDKVEIFIRAYDNDNVSGPKFTDSKHLFLIVPSLEQLFEETATNYESQNKAIESEILRNSKIREDIEKLTQKLRKENIVELQDHKELTKIADQQNKMLDNIKDVEQQIQKNIDLLDKNTMLSTETMKKYKELQKMVGELLTKDMREKLEKLSELSQNTELDKNEMNELLDGFEEQQEEFQKGLDKTLEILKQIKQEYQLDKLIKLSEEMIKDQNIINDQIPELLYNEKQLIKKEEKIEDSFNLLKNEVKSLKNEMKDSNVKQELENLVNEISSEKIPNEFADMKKNLNISDKEKAGKSGEDLRNNFLGIKNSLTEIKDKIVQEKKDEISEELDIIISELIFISDEIEKLKNFSNKLAYNSSHAVELIKDNAEIEKLFNDINPKIFSVAKKTFFIDNQVIAKVGRILEQFDTISRILESRHFSVSTDRHKYIMGNVNQLIILLDKAKDEMNNSKSASGLEEMLKKMEEMAAMQAALNSESQSAMSGGEQSGQSSISKMQEMMNKLAQEQSQLAEALSQMQSDMGMPQSGSEGNP